MRSYAYEHGPAWVVPGPTSQQPPVLSKLSEGHMTSHASCANQHKSANRQLQSDGTPILGFYEGPYGRGDPCGPCDAQQGCRADK